MFFLTKMYENRFDQNMQKHRMDAKIAPPKPKPACRLVNNENEQKHELVKRFMVAQEVKEQASVKIQQTPPSPPPTYQDSFFKPQLASTDSQSSLFEVQKPVFVDAVKIKRSDSHESGFFTGNEDVTSQLSIQA